MLIVWYVAFLSESLFCYRVTSTVLVSSSSKTTYRPHHPALRSARSALIRRGTRFALSSLFISLKKVRLFYFCRFSLRPPTYKYFGGRQRHLLLGVSRGDHREDATALEAPFPSPPTSPSDPDITEHSHSCCITAPVPRVDITLPSFYRMTASA